MSGETAGAGSEPERVVATLRPHGRALFWPSVALIADVGATGWFFGRFDQQWENLAVLGAGAALALLLWVLPLARWLSKRYVITTRRVVLRKGILLRSRQELPHSRSSGIVVRKNALQSLVRSGDIQIDIGPGRPAILRDVPAADLVQRTLHDLMENSMNSIAQRQPVYPQVGPPQFGQPQPGQPQFGQPQPGQSHFAPPQPGQPQFSQPQSGRPSVPFEPAPQPGRQQDETRRWGSR